MIPTEIEKRIQEWLNSPIDPSSKEEIQKLMRQDPKTLYDAFSTNLSFGTGGMRGIMGVGTNRMNRYTIQMATQGLANYLHKQDSIRQTKTVFIGFDSRHHSKEFALEAARVLAGNGIEVYLTAELRPTPFISFGVRQKECSAGIMITASHNPKEYNGYKVYWNDGAQVVPPHDKGIISEVEKILHLDQVKLSPEKSPLIQVVDLEFDFEYLDAIHKLQFDPKEDKKAGDQLKITYTPLHGTGIKLVPRALKQWGFSSINLVPQQSVPDGNFPTVKNPNPENAEALSMGIDHMQKTFSDLLIATDPDADRMGVAFIHRDHPIILNGNQIAVLCLEFIFKKLQETRTFPINPAAITTIVSTDLFSKICKDYHVHCFEVLTGFKYIGELIHNWEKEKKPYHFLFGAEESFGYLMGTHSRDKDAVIASCLIAEIALMMKIEGRTLYDFLEEIHKKYGLFLERQKTLDYPLEKGGMKKMEEIMQKLRKSPPKKIFDLSVTTYEDYLTSTRTSEGKKELLTLPKSNVLLFRLGDNSKIVIRPSGTEPKLKIYAGVYQPYSKAGMKICEEKIVQLLNAFENLLK